MSMGGDPDLNIVQRILLEFDRGSAQESLGEAGKFVVQKMGQIEEEAGRLRASKAKESVKRYARAHMEAMEKVAREEIKLVNKTLNFITKTELEEQRRRNEKLATTQTQAWKRRLADNKAKHDQEMTQVKGHQKRMTELAITHNRMRVNAANEAEKRTTRNHREESDKRVKLFTADLKEQDRVRQTYHQKQRVQDAQAEIRKTSAQKQGERERTIALNAANKQRDRIQTAALREEQSKRAHHLRLIEQKDRASHQRRVNREKAFMSLLRTTNETGQRAIVNMFQAHFRRLHNDRRHNQAVDLASTRRTEDRRLGILRSSARQQQAVVSRTMVRQQGIIASSSQQATGGIIGSLLNTRNILLGAGGFISARAIFGNLQDYEQTQVAFTNLLGSAEEADDLLKELFKFNQRTPFNLAGVQESAKRLLAMGETVEEIIPDLQAIGDVGAKFSASTDDVQGVLRALGQMSQKARVSAQDINQIQERFVGFNARAAIARGLGISVAEAMEQIESGALSGTEGMNAMIEGMKSEENAAGAMEEQMKTLKGSLANFGDLMLSIQIRVLGPFVDEMANAVKAVTSFVDSLFFGQGVFAMIRSGLLGVAAAAGVLISLELIQYLKIFLLGLNPVVIGVLALGAGFSIVMRHFPGVVERFQELAATVASFAVDKLEPIINFFDRLGFAFESVGNLISVAIDDLLAGDFAAAAERFRMAWDRIFKIAVEPAVDVIVTLFQNALGIASDWIASGGVDVIVTGFLDLLSNAVSRVREAAGSLIQSDLFQPMLAGAAVLLAHSVLGIGFGPMILAALGAGLLAVSPTARERITDFFSDVFGNIGDFLRQRLPLILLGGLFAIGNFLGGPVVAAILSETGIKIMAGIAAGIVAGGAALLLGFVEGLRTSLPSAINALQQIFDDLITGAADAFGTGPLGAIVDALVIPLRGLLPILEAVVDLISLIPGPVILAGAAVVLLTKHLVALNVAAKAGQVTGLVQFLNWLRTLPGVVMSAGRQVETFGKQMQVSMEAARMAGTAPTGINSIGQRVFGGMGAAAQSAGTAIKGVGAALPGIGIAAAVGLPVALGLWEAAKNRTQAWKKEVVDLQKAMFEGKQTPEDWITSEAISQIDGLAEALNSVNLEISDIASTLAGGGAADIGAMIASIGGPELEANLRAAGISMAEFGAAVAEGDQAVNKLNTDLAGEGPQIAVARLIDAYNDIPEALRDIVDQTNESAEGYLEQQVAAGALTQAQVDLFVAIKDGEAPTESMISLAGEVSAAQREQATAVEDTRSVVDRLSEGLSEASNQSDGFRDALDRVTGSAIQVGRSRQNIEGVFDTIQAGIEEGQGINELGSNFLSAAEGIIGVFETLSEAGRPRAAAAEYERLRQRLIEQYTQLGLNQTQAEAFTDALVPPVDEIAAAMDQASQNMIDGLREQRRNLRQAIRDGSLSGAGRAAAQEMLGEIDATIASYTPSDIQVMVRAQTETTHWDEVVAAMERQAREHPVEVPVTPVRSTDVPTGGRDLGARGFFGGGPGGGGGIAPDELNLDNITAWQEDVVTMVSNVRAKFEEMQNDVTATVRETGRRLERSFGRTMNNMAEIGRKGANRTVDGITSILRSGALEVARIVAGYARALTNALNPLLVAIGEAKLSTPAAGANILTFAQGGYSPEMAAGSAGPQVHVFNEASSHGEAYIPFDPKHKGRARDIADKSARRLGGRVQWFAEGGISTPVANVTGDWQGLHPEFARRLSTWATALGDVYNVTSGFRTHAEQVAAWNRYQAGTGAPAAVPGTSLHEFGLAADGPHWSNRNPAMQRLTYPMSYEPWHVQPVEGRDLTGGGIMMPQIPQPPDAGAHGVLSRLAEGMMQWAYDKIMAFASSQSMTPPGLASGVNVPGNVAAWIREAMTATGVPSSWFNALVARAMQESSGNPRAINLTDSNAAAGHPSMGLMQTIMSTFQAYALPGHGDIWNPVDNAIAAIRYIIARYGSVFNLPAGGYANGGVITKKQMAWLGEDGPEVVLPLTRPARLKTLLNETGLGDLIAQSLLSPNRPDVEGHLRGDRGSTSRKVDLNLSIDTGGGRIDPVLYSELAGAVRSGVADGMSRADAIQERW